MMGRYWYMYNDGRWTVNWWGMGLEILFWVLLVLLLIWLFNNMARKRDASSGTNTPLDILKTRLAKGEITKEEFEEMKELLK
ncbi:MAG: SHOCT domain-containing protein [Syntrophomonadaceae bacterium]